MSWRNFENLAREIVGAKISGEDDNNGARDEEVSKQFRNNIKSPRYEIKRR